MNENEAFRLTEGIWLGCASPKFRLTAKLHILAER